MKFINHSRKEITISLMVPGANEGRDFTLYPKSEQEMVVQNPDTLVFIRGGTLYGGEGKEFSCGDLRSMREALEEARLGTRSLIARIKIEEVIEKIGY